MYRGRLLGVKGSFGHGTGANRYVRRTRGPSPLARETCFATLTVLKSGGLARLLPGSEQRWRLYPQHRGPLRTGVVEAVGIFRVQQQRVAAFQAVGLVAQAHVEAPVEHDHALLVSHMRIPLMAGPLAGAGHTVDDLEFAGGGRGQQVVLEHAHRVHETASVLDPDEHARGSVAHE